MEVPLSRIHPRLAIAFTLLALACSPDESSDCSDGFYRWQGSCVPVADNDIQGSDWVKEIPDTSEAEDMDAADGGDSLPEAEDVAELSEGVLEVPSSEFVDEGQVGSSCTSPNHCDEGLTCLGGWSGGYCTKQDCEDEGDCPEGSLCASMGDGFKACVDACDAHADCRTEEGYRCKTFGDSLGERVQYCHATDTGASGLGGPCERHEGCDFAMTCQFSFPYGYCSEILCDVGVPCEEGACVRFDGATTCLKPCASAEDCDYQGVDYELSCKSVKNVENVQEKVCLSAVEGKPIGETCMSDFECDGSAGLHCRVMSRGYCALGPEPCLGDGDCLRPNDFCVMNNAGLLGLCTKSCSSGMKCPGTTHCLSQDGADGDCLPGCFTDSACPGTGQMSCVFGDPIASSTGDPAKACTSLYMGVPGAECLGDDECHSGQCLMGPFGRGTCVSACPSGILTLCPFPTTCATLAGQKRCYRRCDPNDNDCPPGFDCASPPGDAPVCTPAPEPPE